MIARKVAVLGAGVAGMASALALARDGHQVILVERDPLDAAAAGDAFAWERKGIPHFGQPHAFIPRGRMELREHWRDVYDSLLGAGASDVDVSRKISGPAEPGDEALQFIAVRRPLIEWGLRKAVLAEPGIQVASGREAQGLKLENSRVTGILLDAQTLPVDFVVDAMGRRSPVRGWLEGQGHALAPQRRSDCGVIYYSRYFRVRPGCALPDGRWLLGPRGDLGYMAFTTFPGDNGTFSALLAVPTGVPELKVFMHEGAFQAAIESIPALRRWTDPELAEPITPVRPMGGLQNSIAATDDALPAGLLQVGDALGHTDPVLAHGMSFALIHALELARALREHAEPLDARDAFRAAVMTELAERFELATALDEQRLRAWMAASGSPARRDADYALFSFVAAGVVAMVEPEVFRIFVRRIGLLDSTRVLDGNEDLQRTIERRFDEMMAQPRPASGPTRDEMLSIARAAVGA